LSFDGAGTVTVLAGTIADRLGDGQVASIPAGITGTFSVDEGCTGLVQFSTSPGAPSLNLVLSPDGRGGTFIQTNEHNVRCCCCASVTSAPS
jgi:hypothetical protein